jgi:hypothetical protein
LFLSHSDPAKEEEERRKLEWERKKQFLNEQGVAVNDNMTLKQLTEMIEPFVKRRDLKPRTVPLPAFELEIQGTPEFILEQRRKLRARNAAPQPAPKTDGQQQAPKPAAPEPSAPQPAPKPAAPQPAPKPAAPQPAPKPAASQPAPKPAAPQPAPQDALQPSPQPDAKPAAPQPAPKPVAPKPAAKHDAPQPAPNAPQQAPKPEVQEEVGGIQEMEDVQEEVGEDIQEMEHVPEEDVEEIPRMEDVQEPQEGPYQSQEQTGQPTRKIRKPKEPIIVENRFSEYHSEYCFLICVLIIFQFWRKNAPS